MKVLKSYPPNIDVIVAALGARNESTIYCYGDTIYNPHDIKLEQDLLDHEKVHMKQQGKDPESWWYRYLSDATFRLSQEVAAYAEQLSFVRKTSTARVAHMALDDFAQSLSGPCYDLGISYSQAHSLIRHAYKGFDS